jgi:hypothetical protein
MLAINGVTASPIWPIILEAGYTGRYAHPRGPYYIVGVTN